MATKLGIIAAAGAFGAWLATALSLHLWQVILVSVALALIVAVPVAKSKSLTKASGRENSGAMPHNDGHSAAGSAGQQPGAWGA